MTQSIAVRQTNDLAAANSPTWREVMETWLNTLDSPATRKVYRRELELAMRDFGDWSGMTGPALAAHRGEWVKKSEALKSPKSPATVRRHLSALRSFLKFASLTHVYQLSAEAIDLALKLPTAVVIKPYQVLNAEERKRLIAAARPNLRDHLLIEIALATGLRAAELGAIRLSDLTVDEDRDIILRVRHGKGGKDRLVPLSTDAAMMVRAYLSSRKLKLGASGDGDEPLFPSRKGQGRGHLGAGSLGRLVRRYAAQAQIEKQISPHALRHTFATTITKRGAKINAVQALLGHESLETTQKYVAHVEMDEMKEAVNA